VGQKFSKKWVNFYQKKQQNKWNMSSIRNLYIFQRNYVKIYKVIIGQEVGLHSLFYGLDISYNFLQNL